MSAILPATVESELQNALEKIGLVLMETNLALSAAGHEDFATVAGSLFYNDPENHTDVPSLSIVLSPVDEEGQEIDFNKVEEEAVVGVYSPTKKAIDTIESLHFTQLSLTSASVGLCCGSRKRMKWVRLPGCPPVPACLKDSSCP